MHRDLKPANVVLTNDDTPHITDFGLAKIMDAVDEDSRAELTASGQILGTPSYMSPEQAAGKQNLVGPASDIYSLGAILYASLTGRAPFVADSPVDTLLQVMRNEPVAPRTLNPSIPRDLETICLKCLNKEPHKRYGTAQELADDLDRFLEGRPVVARPIGPVGRYYRWCQRNPAIAALLVLLFASMAAGTTIASKFAIDATQHAKQEELQRIQAEAAQRTAEKQRALAETSRQEAERQQKAATAARAQAEWSFSQEADARMAADRARRDAVAAREKTEVALANESNARKSAQWQAYVARLRVMQQALAEREYGDLRRLLDESVPHDNDPDFRGWEWYCLKQQVESVTRPVFMDANITGLFQLDPIHNRLVVLRGGNGEIRDATTGNLIQKVALPNVRGESLRISPDGTRIAGGTWNGHVLVADLDQAEVTLDIDVSSVAENDEAKRIQSVAWSPDGGQLLSAQRTGELNLWDAASGDLVRKLQDGGGENAMGGCDWHKDAGLVTGHRWGRIRKWNLQDGEVEWEKRFPNAYVEAVHWNPAGTHLAIGGKWIGVYHSDGTLLMTQPAPGGIPVIAWLDNERFAFGGAQQDITLVDVTNPDEVISLKVHSGRVQSLSPIGNHGVLSGSSDGSIRRTSTSLHTTFETVIDGYRDLARGLAWGPDSKRLATAGRVGTNAVWNAATGERLVELKGHTSPYVHDVSWSFKANQLVTIAGDGEILFWNPDTGEVDHKATTSDSQGTGIDWHPSGESIVFGSRRVHIMQRPFLKEAATTKEHEFKAWPVFSPDGERFGAVSSSGLLRVYDTQTVGTLFEQRLVAGGHRCRFTWSGDGRLFAAAAGRIRIYDANSYQTIVDLAGHRGNVADVDFDPSNRRIASVGSDNDLVIWDAATGDLLLRLPVNDTREPTRVRWSPDGRSIAVAAESGKMRIWNIAEAPTSTNSIDSLEHGIIATKSTQLEALSQEVREQSSQQTAEETNDIADKQQSLFEDLESKDSAKQAKALQQLTAMGPKAAFAIPKLVPLLRRPDSYNKILAIRCLARIGPAAAEAVPALHEVFKSEVSLAGPRAEAGQALARMGTAGEVAIPTLIERLKKPGEPVKIYFATPPDRNNTGLTAQLSRTDEKGTYTQIRDMVLMQTISTLTQFGPAARDAIPAIEEVIDDPDTLEVVRVVATQALQSIRSPAIEIPSAEEVEETDAQQATPDATAEPLPTTATPPPAKYHEQLSQASQQQTQRDPPPVDTHSLIKLLDSKDERERAKVLQSLAKAGPEAAEALPQLLEILRQEDSYDKTLALRCLAAIGPAAAEAVPQLHALLKDKDKQFIFRMEAMGALITIDPTGEGVIPTLINLLRNPGELVKSYPKRGDSPSAAGLMAPMLHKGDDGRWYFDSRDESIVLATGGLGAFGAAAAQAMPELKQVRDNPDMLVVIRESAEKVIDHIQGEVDKQQEELNGDRSENRSDSTDPS